MEQQLAKYEEAVSVAKQVLEGTGISIERGNSGEGHRYDSTRKVLHIDPRPDSILDIDTVKRLIAIDNSSETGVSPVAGVEQERGDKSSHGSGRPVEDVIKKDSELTNLSSCFSTSAWGFEKYTLGTTRIGPPINVYYFGESGGGDSYVIGFARGVHDEYTGQAHSHSTKLICESNENRSISRAIYCGLPETLAIEEKRDIGNALTGIALDPRDLSEYEATDIRAEGAILVNLKLESGSVAPGVTLVKVSFSNFKGKILLFDQDNGAVVALADSHETLTSVVTDNVVKKLFPETTQVLYRPLADSIVIGSAAELQSMRETVRLGKPSLQATLLPSLLSCERNENQFKLKYGYRGETFTVEGEIELKDTEHTFQARGPKASSQGGEYWLREALRETLRVKYPELGFISVKYTGEEPIVDMVPTLKSFEQKSPRDFLVTLRSGQDDFEFEVVRPDQEYPSLYITGQSMGKLADNWARMNVASIFQENRPNLLYNGSHYNPTW